MALTNDTRNIILSTKALKALVNAVNRGSVAIGERRRLYHFRQYNNPLASSCLNKRTIDEAYDEAVNYLALEVVAAQSI